MNIIRQVQGYKTYMVAASLICYAILALYFGKIDGNLFATYVYSALGAITLRSGMKTESERKAALIFQKIQTYLPAVTKEVAQVQATNPTDIARTLTITELERLIEKLKTDTMTQSQQALG